MKKIAKRAAALFLAFMLCICLTPASSMAAEPKYVANWGTRGEVATELSDAALAFYTAGNTYEDFLALESTHRQNDVPQSEIYLALQSFMVKNHTYQTDYQETRYIYCYTDCQDGNYTGPISCFYSDQDIGPAWDAGKTWNREHTWPQSKGSDKDDPEGSDIMVLRPTSMKVNSSRGNKGYGEGSGYYDPDGEMPEGLSVRGDVARVVLYTYVRWGTAAHLKNMWGSSGVIESRDILLKWMAEDPVDTWELARNDSVESITGTRNVFVDYPELAFALFGQAIPQDMVTPSGKAQNQTAETPDPEPAPTEPPATEPDAAEPGNGEVENDRETIYYVAVGAAVILLIFLPAMTRKRGKKRRK